MKYLLGCILALSTLASGTSITLQITDGDGQAWANGTYTLTLVAAPGLPPIPQVLEASGSLNSSGAVTVSVPATPRNQEYMVQVCPQATAACYTDYLVVSSSQTFPLSPPAIRISMANPPPRVNAYADGEITGYQTGSKYFNLTDASEHIYNGSVWTSNPNSSSNANIAGTWTFTNAVLTGPSSGNSLSVMYQVNPLQPLAAPPISVTGSGAATWTYLYVVKDAYGNIAGKSAAANCANQSATLSASAHCDISCPSSFTTYDGNTPTCTIYRTASGGTPPTLGALTGCIGLTLGSVCSDTGLAGDSTTAGVLNGSGSAQAYLSYTIPANYMAPGKGVRCEAVGTYTHSAGTVTTSVNYGGSATGTIQSSSATGTLGIVASLFNSPGTTQNQNLLIQGYGTQAASTAAFTKDSTTAEILLFQFNVASGDSMTPKFLVCEQRQ